MNINLDEKRVKKIIYELNDGSIVAYAFRNGELWSTETLEDVEENNSQKALTDSEMIDRIKQSHFMEELNKAKVKYKLSKEIDETFPEKDDEGNAKQPTRKTSDESIGIINEIIEKDKEGVLDKIAKMKRNYISNNLCLNRDYDEKQFDLWKCEENLKKIENKLRTILRNNSGDIRDNKEFLDTVADYDLYKKKQTELSDEIWNKNGKSIE